MATPDLSITAGNTLPYFNRTLEYEDQTAVDLTGKTVTLMLRDLTSPAPVALTGSMTIVNATAGQVSYQFSAQDTAVPGEYQARFIVTQGGDTMDFPTDGYLWVEIQSNLVNASQQLVGLGSLKQYLNITATDRRVDSMLMQKIAEVRPVVEEITGPILPQTFDEWHDGGQTYIMLRRRPSTGFGTSPVINLIACSEYNGPIEWPLAVVASPDRGQLYSVMLDVNLGRVVRRTAGGGVMAFPLGPQAVHVVYQAGQSSVPANVREGTLEILRINYEQTMKVGKGSATFADEADTGPPLGFYVPRRVREMLSPNRRFPSLA